MGAVSTSARGEEGGVKTRMTWVRGCCVVVGLWLPWSFGLPQMQAPGAEDRPYSLSVSVDEVNLTFHAVDGQGRPVTDLTADDVEVFDNGRQPRRIMLFEGMTRLPVRAGLVFDTSRSVLGDLAKSQQVARLYATQMLAGEADRAFVMRFDSESKVTQGWTSRTDDLVSSVRGVAADHASRMGGTILFDALYRACRDEWDARETVATGNFLLLFTDGVDNASHSHLDEVVSMCQRRRVSIYVVASEARSRFDQGQKTLERLARESGGAMFFARTAVEAEQDLRSIDTMVRGQYRLVYKPPVMKRDGAFHAVRVRCKARCAEVIGPSGYYPPR